MSKPLLQDSTKQHFNVSPESLPLSCPLQTNPLWDNHPRVYLPITETGHVTCPYCGTKYTLCA